MGHLNTEIVITENMITEVNETELKYLRVDIDDMYSFVFIENGGDIIESGFWLVIKDIGNMSEENFNYLKLTMQYDAILTLS